MCPVDNHAQEGIQYLPIMHLDIEFQVLKHSYMYAHVEVHSTVCFKTSTAVEVMNCVQLIDPRRD